MVRGWMLTLGLAVLVVAGAVAASTVSRSSPPAPQQIAAPGAPADAGAWDPCFRYGRFECCVRPEER